MENRVKIILSAQDETQKAIQSVTSSLDNLSGKLAILAGKFLIIKSAAESAIGSMVKIIQPAYKAVEDYNLAVTKAAALITSMMPRGDLAENYRIAKEYAAGLVTEMEKLDARTLASLDDLMMINEELVKQGIILNTNNKNQMEGFLNLANAVSVVAMGYPNKEIQLRQEIRALINGEIRATNQLAQQLDALVGGTLKQKVEKWKQSGELVERLGELLVGYAAASGDIEATWAAIGSTLKTIYTVILRDGFLPAYQAINKFLISLNEHLRMHSEILSGNIHKAWVSIKGSIESIYNLLKPFMPLFQDIATILGTILDGFGLMGAVILPIITERLNHIIKSVMDIGEAFGNIWNAIGYAMIGQFSKAGELLKGAVGKFQEAGGDAGKAFAGGLSAEIEKRYREYIGDISRKEKKAGLPSIESRGMSPEEKERVRARINERLKIELEGLKVLETQRLEAYKTEAKELELKHRQGLISEKEFIDEKNKLQENALVWSIVYLNKEKQLMQDSWNERKDFYDDEKERIKEKGEIETALLRFDEEIIKKKEELHRAGIAATIEDIEYAKKLAEAKRESDLKIMESEIDLQKQLNALRVERGEITSEDARRKEAEAEIKLLQAKIEILKIKEKEAITDKEKISIMAEIMALRKELNNIEISSAIAEIQYSKKIAEAKREGELKILESEISLRKQLNSIKVEKGEMREIDARIADVEAEKELLEVKKRNLEAKKQDVTTTEEGIAVESELIAIEKQLTEVEVTRAALTEEAYGNFWEGYSRGLRNFLNDTNTVFRHGVNIAIQTARAMQDAFSSFFFDAMQGKLKSLTDYINSFLASVQKALADLLGQQLVRSLGNFLFPSIAGTTMAGNFLTMAHEGGYIPRYHFGGSVLKSDEVLAILQKGEYVVSRAGVAALDAINQGKITKAELDNKKEIQNYYYINAVDSKSFADMVMQNPSAIVSILHEDKRRGNILWR